MATGAAPPGEAEEESRYQATQALDPLEPAQLEKLLSHLADGSWRVRSAASERIASHPRPAEVLPALLEVATAGSSPGARSAAAGALTRLGAAAVGPLLPRLASDRPEERCAAADVLGEIADRRAALALADLLGDGHANVRVSAAEALGKVGGSYAVKALLGALAGADASLRVAALDALERLGVSPPVERLAQLVEDRGARASAYRILALSSDPRAPALLAQGVAEMSRSVREAAYLSVARLARTSPDALQSLAAAVRESAAQAPSLVPWALEAMSAGNLLVAEGAIRVLGWSGQVGSARTLAAAAEEESLRPAVGAALQALGPGIVAEIGDTPTRLSPPARVAVLAALVRVGKASAIPELAAAADSSDGSVRSQAIEALGRSEGEAAVAPLARLLDHPDPEVSGLAAAALEELALAVGRLRGAVLLWCRPAGEERTPAALLRLLGQIGEEQDSALVRRGLRDPRPATRIAAAQAIGALAVRRVVACAPPEVLDTLDDPQPRVRAAAAAALGALGAAGALAPGTSGDFVRALGAAMRDEAAAVRSAAARAAGACQIDRLAGSLVSLVEDAEPDVASSALHALAQMGRADLPLLERAAAHPDAEVAKEAMGAASRQPGARAQAILLGGLCHPSWDVRRAAARAVADRGDRSLSEALQDVAGVEEDSLVAEALAEALHALEG
jgi:HEAT repeat protein